MSEAATASASIQSLLGTSTTTSPRGRSRAATRPRPSGTAAGKAFPPSLAAPWEASHRRKSSSADTVVAVLLAAARGSSRLWGLDGFVGRRRRRGGGGRGELGRRCRGSRWWWSVAMTRWLAARRWRRRGGGPIPCAAPATEEIVVWATMTVGSHTRSCYYGGSGYDQAISREMPTGDRRVFPLANMRLSCGCSTNYLKMIQACS